VCSSDLVFRLSLKRDRILRVGLTVIRKGRGSRAKVLMRIGMGSDRKNRVGCVTNSERWKVDASVGGVGASIHGQTHSLRLASLPVPPDFGISSRRCVPPVLFLVRYW